MSTAHADKFEKIAQDAIQAAERVKCSFPAFVEGLKVIRSEINDRVRTAEDELSSMEDR